MTVLADFVLVLIKILLFCDFSEGWVLKILETIVGGGSFVCMFFSEGLFSKSSEC